MNRKEKNHKMTLQACTKITIVFVFAFGQKNNTFSVHVDLVASIYVEDRR